MGPETSPQLQTVPGKWLPSGHTELLSLEIVFPLPTCESFLNLERVKHSFLKEFLSPQLCQVLL